ncbi:hypothetical protein HPB52_010885 [Rhipicephalus sanguineus]|uniref:Peptidase M13 C-terminal domain-containing protein n=1 Tax=Rhipicephalus sanguineus TaxID=34632 RepID=A0A9D4SP02_RHISA|nr:hypothetical protein HPB52_010885 [Rhipicephalus sanguineus]
MLSLGRRYDLDSWRLDRAYLLQHGAYEDFVRTYVIVLILHLQDKVSNLQVTQRGEGRVPLTWLLPPRFGADLPPTLNYGAFGLELAAGLLRGTPFDKSWLDCLEQLEPGFSIATKDEVAVRLALATEAAETFVERHNRVGHPLVLPGLESFTEGMMFYVGVCSSMCTRDSVEIPHRCNIVAKNSKNFAKVFGCHEGSPMNPVERCSYPNLTMS